MKQFPETMKILERIEDIYDRCFKTLSEDDLSDEERYIFHNPMGFLAEAICLDTDGFNGKDSWVSDLKEYLELMTRAPQTE